MLSSVQYGESAESKTKEQTPVEILEVDNSTSKFYMLLRNINYESPEVSHSHLYGSDTDAGCATHYFSYSQYRNELFLSNLSLLPHSSFQDKILNL
jgi:hypothetical protein